MTYFDASAFVSFFLGDVHSDGVRVFVERQPSVVVSDLTLIEFASAVSRAVRTRRLSPARGQELLLDVDVWALNEAIRFDISTADIRVADRHVRQFDLGLRPPDAIHIAICQRLGLALATCDELQANAARVLGVGVINLSAGAIA